MNERELSGLQEGLAHGGAVGGEHGCFAGGDGASASKFMKYLIIFLSIIVTGVMSLLVVYSDNIWKSCIAVIMMLILNFSVCLAYIPKMRKSVSNSRFVKSRFAKIFVICLVCLVGILVGIHIVWEAIMGRFDHWHGLIGGIIGATALWWQRHTQSGGMPLWPGDNDGKKQ